MGSLKISLPEIKWIKSKWHDGFSMKRNIGSVSEMSLSIGYLFLGTLILSSCSALQGKTHPWFFFSNPDPDRFYEFAKISCRDGFSLLWLVNSFLLGVWYWCVWFFILSSHQFQLSDIKLALCASDLSVPKPISQFKWIAQLNQHQKFMQVIRLITRLMASVTCFVIYIEIWLNPPTILKLSLAGKWIL